MQKNITQIPTVLNIRKCSIDANKNAHKNAIKNAGGNLALDRAEAVIRSTTTTQMSNIKEMFNSVKTVGGQCSPTPSHRHNNNNNRR